MCCRARSGAMAPRRGRARASSHSGHAAGSEGGAHHIDDGARGHGSGSGGMEGGPSRRSSAPMRGARRSLFHRASKEQPKPAEEDTEDHESDKKNVAEETIQEVAVPVAEDKSGQASSQKNKTTAEDKDESQRNNKRSKKSK